MGIASPLMNLFQLAAAQIRRSRSELSRGMYVFALCLASWIGSSGLLQAQGAPGSNDPTFNVLDNGTYGDGASSLVLSLALQPDGKVLIGGSFTSYNNILRNSIARLNADGSLDASFNPGTGVGGGTFPRVNSLALQPDGKVLIGGGFSAYNGTPRRYVARLNADGSLDASFNPGTGADASVYTVALQSDGKVLISGIFTSYNGTPRRYVARLNSDGEDVLYAFRIANHDPNDGCVG